MSSVSTPRPSVLGSSTLINSCVLKGAKDLHIEERLLPPPAASELQIAIRATGLCGSDLHYYNEFRNGDIIVREPMALGHESAGVVVEVGAGVVGFHEGDKVALEVGLPCDQCPRCLEGRYNLCKSMRFRSSAKAFPHFQGTMQDRINHPAQWCHKLPGHMSLGIGALLEPLSVAIHAARRAGPLEGTSVCVLGAGTIGALMAAVAKLKGASTVVIADIDAGRVEFATQNGFADYGYIVKRAVATSLEDELRIAQETASEIVQVISKRSDRVADDIDVVFECTGVTSSVRTGIYVSPPGSCIMTQCLQYLKTARSGGKLLLIGMGTPMHLLPISAAALREVDILGVFRYANTYPEGIEMFSRNKDQAPDFTKLITHHVHGLQNAEKAFEIAGKPKDDSGNLVMKVILEN